MRNEIIYHVQVDCEGLRDEDALRKLGGFVRAFKKAGLRAIVTTKNVQITELNLQNRNKFDLDTWWVMKGLSLTCALWKLNGLKTCKKHGFSHQRWSDGYCKKCKRLIR